MKHWREINLEFYLIEYDCIQMVIDYPWIRHLTLVVNPRLKSCWGRAWNQGEKNWGTVELAQELFDLHRGHLKEILIHELCHFVAAHHGDYGHGKEFKKAMEKYTGRKIKTRFAQGMYDNKGKLKLVS